MKRWIFVSSAFVVVIAVVVALYSQIHSEVADLSPVEPPAEEITSLESNKWVLERIQDSEGQISEAIPDITTISFDGSKAFGSTGCNMYTSEYQVSEKNLSFGLMQSTMMACDELIMNQADRFIELLSEVDSYTIDTTMLKFTNETGQTILQWSLRTIEE